MGNLRANLYLLFCTLLWGATFSLVKGSLAETGPIFLNFVRFATAALLLLPIFLTRIKKIKSNTLMHGTLLGFSLFIGFSFQSIGLVSTSAHRSAFLTQMLVIFTPFLQLIFMKQSVKHATLAGIAIVLPGLYLLLSPEASFDFNSGDAASLACAFFFSVYMLLLDRARNEDLLCIVFLQVSVTALLSGIGFLLKGEWPSKFPSASYLASMSYLIVATTLVTTFLQAKYQKQITAARAGVLYSMEPVFATIFAYFVLKETTSLRGIVGGGLIIAGVMISEIFSTPTRERPRPAWWRWG